jgi:hypothetical protein
MASESTSYFRAAIGILFLVLVLIQYPSTAPANELPQEFTANYVLQMSGTVLARATYTLEHTDTGVTMKQSTRPVGLIALLRDDKIDVRSDMIVDEGRLLLVNYDYTHSGDNKDRNVRFKINWQTNHKQGFVGKASGIYEGRHFAMSIDNPVWDPLSIQVPIMRDANKNLPPHELGLFMNGEFKHYLFESSGSETVKYNGMQLTAVKMAGRETKRDRAMFVWMVPEYHNIPIKIEQWKNGKLKSTVLLESVTFDEDGRSRTLSLTNKPSSKMNSTVAPWPDRQRLLAVR